MRLLWRPLSPSYDRNRSSAPASVTKYDKEAHSHLGSNALKSGVDPRVAMHKDDQYRLYVVRIID